MKKHWEPTLNRPLTCPKDGVHLIHLESNTVILLHGINSSENTWRDEWAPGLSFVSFLEENHFSVQTPNFDLPCAKLGTNASVLLLELRNLHFSGIQSYSIVGHSAGGLVARYYLTSFPELGNLGLHVKKLITLGTPHHGSPLAKYRVGPVKDYFCNSYNPILDELIPGNATLNMLNYGLTSFASEDTCCHSHAPEIRIGLDPTRVYCIAGTHPEAKRSKTLSKILAVKFGCPINDGIVPEQSAYLWGVPPQNRWLDSQFNSDDCFTEHCFGDNAFTKNSCIANVVKRILNDDPPEHPTPRLENDSPTEPLVFLPNISRTFEPGESLVDSSLVLGLEKAMFFCTWSGDSLEYYLETPSGQFITETNSDGNPDVECLASNLGSMFLIDFPEQGMWKHHVNCPSAVASGTLDLSTGFDSQLKLIASVTREVLPSETFACSAQFTRSGIILPNARVVAEVMKPNGNLVSIPLVDNGTCNDPVPGDGEYWGTVAAEGQTGLFNFVFCAIEDSTMTESEARETQDVGLARTYSNIEVPVDEFLISDQNPSFGDLVTFSAKFRNVGQAAADSVMLTIENLRYGLSIADTIVSLNPGEEFEMQASWMAAVEDTNSFQAIAMVVEGSIDEDASNNVAGLWAFISSPELVSGIPGDSEPFPDGETKPGSHVAVEVFPNPSNFGAEIKFKLAVASLVDLSIYDLAGRKVRDLLQGHQQQGDYRILWDGKDQRGASVGSGVYLCRLNIAEKTQIIKMAVVK